MTPTDRAAAMSKISAEHKETDPMTKPELLAVRDRESALARLDPQALITKALETGAGIDTMERLVALAKDVREVQAKEAWYQAMAEFQRTCPAIKKTKEARIATRTGPGYVYRFAPLDEIMSTIQPVMGPLGLSVSWRSRVEPAQVVVACRVSHTLGHHEESGEIAMPVVQGDGSGANPAQRVGIAATYAKRYALLGIIGMAPEDDDDAASQEAKPEQAHDEGQIPLPGQGTITEPQHKRFYAIARGTKPTAWTDEQLHDLLASYKLNAVAEIPVVVYDRIVERLKQGPEIKK